MSFWTEIAELLELPGLKRKSLVERAADKVQGAVQQAAGSVGRTGDAAGRARRRTSAHLRSARERATRVGRDALAERVESIARRAEEIRGARDRYRERRRDRAERRRARQRAPMRLDVRRDDRILLRGRRDIDVRMTDGSVIRYRFYEHPSFGQRLYLRLRGRQVWPPR